MNASNRTQVARFVRIFSYALALLALSGILAEPSSAGLFTLVDGNSSADFDTNASFNAYNWNVDGVDQLFEQSFWYRIGNSSEAPVHSLPVTTEGTTDTNFDGAHDTLFVRYGGQGFDIEIRYVLDGGLPFSGAADMGEQVSVSNLTDSPLDFHIFQYVDFDLGAGAGGDRGVFTNPNTVRQWKGLLRLTETVVTPVPSHRELDFYPATLGRLNDAVATTLSDTPIGAVLGPGDVTWAYQWDTLISPRGTFQISKDKNLSAGVIPEPASLVLISFAGVFMMLRRKR
jgi:hypothetical protein